MWGSSKPAAKAAVVSTPSNKGLVASPTKGIASSPTVISSPAGAKAASVVSIVPGGTINAQEARINEICNVIRTSLRDTNKASSYPGGVIALLKDKFLTIDTDHR